jgi:hypothetical protein
VVDQQERALGLAAGLRDEQRQGEAPGAPRPGDGDLDDLARAARESRGRDLDRFRGRERQVLAVDVLPELREQFRARRPSHSAAVVTAAPLSNRSGFG